MSIILKVEKIFKHHVLNASTYVDGIFKGVVSNRRADLARSITLIETTSSEKKALAQALLNKVLRKLKHDRETNKKVCLRVGEVH